MKRRLLMYLLILAAVTGIGSSPVGAMEYLVGGKPFTLLGYVAQGGAYGLHNDYDTKHGLQSALTTFFVEGNYKPTQNLSMYSSLRYTTDWAYELNRHDSSWSDKLFEDSRSRMGNDNNYWQVLNELHMTWRPQNFMFRIGKQIVTWGEMDGFRIMDQINPLDARRGFADVEFENTIIPIWLLRSEWYPKIESSWLQDLTVEFTFNPNADFITGQDIVVGNADAGIWAPYFRVEGPGGFIFGDAFYNLEKPARWSSRAFEYAFRIKGIVKDTVLSLNYFYGLDNQPVLKINPNFDPFTGFPPASNGRTLAHFLMDGEYRRLHFVGLSASRDIALLKSSALGGVNPVVRFEGFYAFNETFTDQNLANFEKSDELRAGLGVDWKIKIPALNSKSYFTISPQVVYRRVMDLPAGQEYNDAALVDTLHKDNLWTSLFLSTQYFNAKLVPSVFWMRDVTNDGNFLRVQATYDWSTSWRFTLGAVFLDGNKPNYGFEVFDNKDYVFGKVQYKFQ